MNKTTNKVCGCKCISPEFHCLSAGHSWKPVKKSEDLWKCSHCKVVRSGQRHDAIRVAPARVVVSAQRAA